MAKDPHGIAPLMLHHTVEGQGPDLVLLHPAGLDGRSWDAVAGLLGGRFRLLRIDLRGHGGSPPCSPGMSLRDHAGDVAHTMAEVGFRSAAVCGLSVGGMLAQALALDHPHRVSRLIVAGCPCTLPDAARPMMAARGAAALAGGMQAVVEDTLKRWFTQRFLESGGAEAVRQRLLTDDPQGWNGIWQAISGLDFADELHRISMPTLCIAGELDPAAPPAALQAIAERISGAQLLVIADAPHIMQVETPAAFAAEITRFLLAG